jgi:hypothetical protein
MEASLTYYPTVQVQSQSGEPGKSCVAKCVPLCLVRSVRLCHSYSVTRNLVRVSRNRYQIPCRMFRRYVSWTHVLSHGTGRVANGPTCKKLRREKCTSVSGTQFPTVPWLQRYAKIGSSLTRKRYQIPYRMVRRYVSWTHVLSNGTGSIAIGPTWTKLRREKCTSVSGTQFPTVP